ncbi:MAG TPA: VOC family protein [Actinomycetota bacterium]|jgi:predicted enzyme related to lactoylglutathione lyase
MLGPIDHVYYTVQDLGRAVAFYQETLGLSLLRRDDPFWAELDGGTVRLALHATREGAPVERGGAVAAFRVEDLDAAIVWLKEKGIEVSHQGEVEGYGRFALFPDPDGNQIEIIEYAQAGD